MEDLNGLDWSAPSQSTKPGPFPSGNFYPTLRPTPPPQNSGKSTPVSAQASGTFRPPSKPAPAPKTNTPDSFSNLVSFGSAKQATLTLQQQQAKLQADKLKAEAEKRRQYEAQFGNPQFWDGVGNKGSPAFTPLALSRSTTPAGHSLSPNLGRTVSPLVANGDAIIGSGEDNDLFAAFNADTKVDTSSYYPPPSMQNSGRSTPAATTKPPDLSNPQAWQQSGSVEVADLGEDDDPFGLSQLKQRSSALAPSGSNLVDEDILGDLGKPVEEIKRPHAAVKTASPVETEVNDPWDNAVAELVEMGFSAEQSRRALTESGSGLDVQSAVGWILNDAHRQAKEKQQSRNPSQSNGSESSRIEGDILQDPSRRGHPLARKKEDRETPKSRTEDRASTTEADISKTAAAVGSNILKTANSLWKQSQKKVQKAVAEFQQDSDPSQPKWMREAAERERVERSTTTEKSGRRQPAAEVTDEALMLEGGSRPFPRKVKGNESRSAPPSSSLPGHQSPSTPQPVPQRTTPRWQQQYPQDPRPRVSKQAIEEQSAQAYVSPARRKKTTSQPSASSQPDLDLLSAGSMKGAQASQPTSRSSLAPSPKPSTPIPVRPKAPPRQIPHLSAIALQSSTQHRLAGTSHYKRGDYASAHSSYSSSLSALPASHPITIILLCNRALTSLKTGVPKEAVSDADKALDLIGSTRGEGEIIELGPGEGGGSKEMKEFWEKALMRKAEALEQMERWSSALDVWKLCVEGSVGGSTAIQGRGRCEKALAPKPPPSRLATPKVAIKPKPKPNSPLADLGGEDSAAVRRLREANERAGKEDDEKFALSEKVEAKIGLWRDGKRDNLRALIGSLDSVMWEGSGWKKVGMHELIQNNKVKINYMKAIGKCHPDKLPQGASTEIRMIAALVFATLNESWDKFKEQNGM